jgi:methionyl-tRNA synthetase
VQSAEAAGMPVAEFVRVNAQKFADLHEGLDLSNDDFIRTASDPRHRPGVEKMWRACADAGDVYTRNYQGLYCVGCEQFYLESELIDGKCPEHLTKPTLVTEENYFFRLSKYQQQLHDAISRDVLEIKPSTRKNEMLRFIERGLDDFSISRSAERARGWGIPVPGDESQIMYVWFDALGNYISALGYGGKDDSLYERFWLQNDERVHVIGKGILRFHAIYWPAMLLSAKQPLPRRILVHDYLTVDGQKISKSLGNTADPFEIAGRYGKDALRWWMLREVPQTGDADFSIARLIARANEDLANDLGNLLHRSSGMLVRYRAGVVPKGAAWDPDAAKLERELPTVAARVDACLADFDFRGALDAIWSLVSEANKLIERRKPWELYKAEQAGGSKTALDAVFHSLYETMRVIARELSPFIPGAAAEMTERLSRTATTGEKPLFQRIES